MSSKNFGKYEILQRHNVFELKIARRSIKVVLIIFLSVISSMYVPPSSRAKANQDAVESMDGWVKCLYQDTKHVLTAPFHWKQDDLVLFSTLSISTFELMLLDRDFQESVQKNRTYTTDRISRWTDQYTKRVTNLTIGGLYITGLLFQDTKLKKTSLLCLESVAIAEGITQGLKHLIGRSRPWGNKGAFNFDPFKYPPPPYSLSFPSGHATVAFALSSVISEQYRSWWVSLISYSFAVTVALGRVNNQAHFVSDVFCGGIIGTAVGRCLVKFHQKEDSIHDCELLSVCKSDDFRLGILIWVK